MNEPEARPQQWDDCDADIRAFLEQVVAGFRGRLADRLTGVYLHGSLAMGCYFRPKSDLDLLVVVGGPLPPEERRRLAQICVALSDERPTPGDLELSVVQMRHTCRFAHPLAFEVHYGDSHKEQIRRGESDYTVERRDDDLAAHCTVTRARGVTLAGAAILDVFGPVPWEMYVASVLGDFDWIVEGEHILKSPYYGVLNCCRVLQLLTEGEGTVASKVEGAAWALARLPESYRPIVGQALACYRSARPVSPEKKLTGGMDWDALELRRFRDFVAREVAALR